MYLSIYVNKIYIYMCVCIYTHIYTYTYIHIIQILYFCRLANVVACLVFFFVASLFAFLRVINEYRCLVLETHKENKIKPWCLQCIENHITPHIVWGDVMRHSIKRHHIISCCTLEDSSRSSAFQKTPGTLNSLTDSGFGLLHVITCMLIVS